MRDITSYRSLLVYQPCNNTLNNTFCNLQLSACHYFIKNSMRKVGNYKSSLPHGTNHANHSGRVLPLWLAWWQHSMLTIAQWQSATELKDSQRSENLPSTKITTGLKKATSCRISHKIVTKRQFFNYFYFDSILTNFRHLTLQALAKRLHAQSNGSGATVNIQTSRGHGFDSRC